MTVKLLCNGLACREVFHIWKDWFV